LLALATEIGNASEDELAAVRQIAALPGLASLKYRIALVQAGITACVQSIGPATPDHAARTDRASDAHTPSAPDHPAGADHAAGADTPAAPDRAASADTSARTRATTRECLRAADADAPARTRTATGESIRATTFTRSPTDSRGRCAPGVPASADPTACRIARYIVMVHE
jgi:hypothetical protein